MDGARKTHEWVRDMIGCGLMLRSMAERKVSWIHYENKIDLDAPSHN